MLFLMLREFLYNGYNLEIFILKKFFNEKIEYIEKMEKNDLGFYVKNIIRFEEFNIAELKAN